MHEVRNLMGLQYAYAESQKQYWQVKSKYRDTVIFFKVGKFYELYEVRASLACMTLREVSSH